MEGVYCDCTRILVIYKLKTCKNRIHALPKRAILFYNGVFWGQFEKTIDRGGAQDQGYVYVLAFSYFEAPIVIFQPPLSSNNRNAHRRCRWSYQMNTPRLALLEIRFFPP